MADNKLLWVAAGFLLAAVLGLPLVISLTKEPEPAPAPAPIAVSVPVPAVPPVVEPPPRPVVTQEMVEKLLYGMTYEQVAEKFGGESDDMGSEYDRGTAGYTSPTVTVFHVWKNPDGSRARVGFVNGKLESKTYLGRGSDPEDAGGDSPWEKEYKL